VKDRTKRKAFFLDRDGVLNKVYVRSGLPYPPKVRAELELLPGASKAVKLLKENNFEIVVITNQPDVARGTTSRETVEEFQKYIMESLNIEYFYTCFHDDKDDCACRKPKPGLILTAAQELDICLNSSFMVGDRWKDIAAGQAAGCKCYWINNSYKEIAAKLPYTKVSSLIESVNIVLKEQRRAKF
jgi:D-glycero-D-manno-heptose 1,7-bisphosphate phosphatase